MTTSNILATKNSWISIDNPTINNGSDTSLRVSTKRSSSTSSSNTIVCEAALLGFNLDALGVSTVTSATLYIYGGGSVVEAPAIMVFPITDYTWTESGVTWNNQPTHNPKLGSLNVYRNTIGTLAKSIDGSNHQWQTFDLTAYVKAQNDAAVEAEIMLYPDTGYNFTTAFDSRVGTNVPYIKTVYT